MTKLSKITAALTLASDLTLVLPLHAQLLTEKILSAEEALTIARSAYESCAQQGYRVSVHVVGREGQVLAAIRGDGSSPHTFENSLRKAYTAQTFKTASGDLVKRLKDNPTASFVYLNNVVAAQGALPVKVGDETIGAVGVSGAPGGDKDEACSRVGIDKIFAELK